MEAPFQGRVLLDVLPVLVQRGRADAAQFAARQLRLEHVARVHSALGLAGPHDCVELVNEQNNAPLAGGNFLEERLEPILKFAAVLRSSNHGADVHRHEPFVL